MTKEQEREALKKIEKIIKEAGPDSYIGMTFAGIVEQAEENIANDFGSNYKEMYENEQERSKVLSDGLNELRQQAERNAEKLTAELDKYKAWYEQKMNRIDELNKELSEASDDWKELFNEQEALKLENHNQKSEIITLKAKLYDLMTQ